MAEYHVGCGAFAIYAGTLNAKNKNLWQNKTECTDEAINSVRDYMVREWKGCRVASYHKTTSGIKNYNKIIKGCWQISWDVVLYSHRG